MNPLLLKIRENFRTIDSNTTILIEEFHNVDIDWDFVLDIVLKSKELQDEIDDPKPDINECDGELQTSYSDISTNIIIIIQALENINVDWDNVLSIVEKCKTLQDKIDKDSN